MVEKNKNKILLVWFWSNIFINCW